MSEIPIRYGKYIDPTGIEQKVIFVGAEKAIYDENGKRLDVKMNETVTKDMISNVQIDDQNKVPTSALAFAMKNEIDQLNENMKNLISKYGIKHFDYTVPSAIYASKEEKNIDIPNPNAHEVFAISVVGATTPSHIAQFRAYGVANANTNSREIYVTIKNVYTGSLTDAIKVRCYYLVGLI